MVKKLINILICLLLIFSIFTLVNAETADEWPMFRHDLQHTGYTSAIGPTTNNVMWNVTISGGVSSSPAFWKGRFYIGSEDGNIYCIDAEPGDGNDEMPVDDPENADYDIIWKFQTGGPVRSSPAVYDGKLYFGSDDGKVYCIYACIGTEIWNYSTGDVVRSSPSIYNHNVYIGSNDGNIYCFDADADSSQEAHQWTSVTGGPVRSSPAVYDGFFYIGSDDGKIYCMHASNGTEFWNYTTGGAVQSSPAIKDGKVYVGSDDGNFYCIYSSNGTEFWNYTTGDMIRSSPAIDEKIYVGSDDGNLYCLALNGTEYWNKSIGENIRSSPAITDGKIYVGSHDGKIYCFNLSDGIDIWSYQTDDNISSSTAILNRRAYVASESGNIICFRDHNPPNIPNNPDGPTDGLINVEYIFTTETIDPEGDEIYYMFNWGDGKQTEWLGPFSQGETVDASHKWNGEGNYDVRVKSKDGYEYESYWSEPSTIRINILEINMIRGGIGIHAEIKNIGSRKLWRLPWDITIEGGLIQNTATGDAEGELLNLGAGESVEIGTGPFFEFGRIQITISINDEDTDNSALVTVKGFSIGHFVILTPWRNL